MNERNRMIKKLFISILLIFVTAISIVAQGFDGASLGMGRAYGALATGVDAIAWNPANLVLPRDSFMELNIFSLNLNMANSSFNIDNYNRYFTNEGHKGWWSDTDKKAILDLIDEDGLNAYGDLNSNVLGLTFGNFAFAVQGTGNFFLTFPNPKLPIELFLFGNTNKDKILQFKNVDGNGYGAIKISFAASYPVNFKKYFDVFGVGLNFNYFRGFQYFEVNKGNGYFNTSSSNFKSKVTFEGKRANGGTGLSLDLGGSGIIKKKWTVSLVFQNIYSGFNWNDNPEAFLSSVTIDSGDITNPEDIQTINQDTVVSINEFNKKMPLVIHAGAAYNWGKNWIFSADVEQAFGNEMGYTDKTLFSAGAQFNPIKILPLRAGLTLGGKWGFLFGIGVGLRTGIFQMDLGYSMHRAMWPTLSRGNSFAFSTKLTL
jgi:hypothetical protein